MQIITHETGDASPDWPWRQVRGALLSRGFTLEEAAQQWGCSQPELSRVAKRPDPKLEAAIAKIIGVSAEEIWPTRYTAHGLPVDRSAWLRARGRDRHGVERREVA